MAVIYRALTHGCDGTTLVRVSRPPHGAAMAASTTSPNPHGSLKSSHVTLGAGSPPGLLGGLCGPHPCPFPGPSCMLPPAPLLSISRPHLGVHLSGPECLRTFLPWLVLHPMTPSSTSLPLGLFALTGASPVPDQLPPEPKSSVQMVHLLCWWKAPEPGTASGWGSMGQGPFG